VQSSPREPEDFLVHHDVVHSRLEKLRVLTD